MWEKNEFCLLESESLQLYRFQSFFQKGLVLNKPKFISLLSAELLHILVVAIAPRLKGSLYAIKTYVVYTRPFILQRAGSFSPEMPPHRRGLSWPPSSGRSFLLTLAYCNLLISYMVLFRIYNHIFACLLICCLLPKLERRPHEG